MRLKTINSFAALFAAITMSTAVMVSSMTAIFNNSPNSPVITANGYGYDDAAGVYGYTGAEDCDKIFEFNNDYTVQNKWKLYSVFREMGMSRVQALAALGSCACEGGFHTEIIEYAESASNNTFQYLLPNSDQVDTSRTVDANTAASLQSELNGLVGIDKIEKIEDLKYREGILVSGNQSGGHKHWELDSWSRYNKHTEEVFDEYVEKYSQYLTDPRYSTIFTDDTMRGYGANEATIEQLHSGAEVSFRINGNGLPIHASFYYVNGVGKTGAGLYGFTGPVLDRLIEFAKERDTDWYDPDVQIAFLVSPNGYDYSGLTRYIENTKDCTTIEECMTHGGDGWFYLISGGVDPHDGQDDARNTAARQIEKQLPVNNDRWDSVYAQRVLADAGLEPVAERAGINDEGILQHYAQKVLHYPQNTGFILEKSDNNDMKDANESVFKEYVSEMSGSGTTYSSPTYSLFELFGEDLHWYRYFGESTYTPTLLDHIWSAIDQDKTETLLNSPIATINYEAYNYLSCNVYPGRPRVLAASDLTNGDYDPRVTSMAKGWFDGTSYVQGSIQMGISKFCVSVVSFLAGPTIKTFAIDALTKLEENDIWDGFKPIAFLVLGFAMCAFIISIAKKAIKYSKGTGSAKETITRFVVGVLAIGLFGVCLANPAGLNNGILNVTNFVDTVFGYALQGQIQNDEVICVTDPDKAVHAVLWKKAIFGCWCRGQFDLRNYDELYTYYSPITSGQSKMPQSHEQIDFNDQTGKAYYDSVSNTGDIGVPVGGGKVIKNWAAYLYSCGSKYHIDSTIDKDVAQRVNLTEEIYFPHSTLQTTANDPSIEADTFRIIDAQMNISPQYFATGTTVYDYDDSHVLRPWYILESSLMLFNCALLLFLVPPIFKKLTSFILLMATIIKMIYFAILELFKEDSGFSEFWETCKKHFFDYVTASLKLCILVELYYLFVDEGFIKLVMFCILALVVLGFNLKDARRAINDVKHTAQRIKTRGGI